MAESKWKRRVKKLSLKKLREKLRAINRRRKRLTKKGREHDDLDAQRRRLVKKIEYLENHQDPVAASDGTADYITPSGQHFKVAGWMVGAFAGPDGKTKDWLGAIRRASDWSGELYSAWRSPEYSKGLCYAQCNAPVCPGTCAGEASNHSQTRAPSWGAIDVKDHLRFIEGARKVGAPLKNELGVRDPNHMSPSGR